MGKSPKRRPVSRTFNKGHKNVGKKQMQKGHQQMGGGNGLPEISGGVTGTMIDIQPSETVTISTSTILALLALVLLGVIVYLAYTRSMDERQSGGNTSLQMGINNTNKQGTNKKEKMTNLPAIPAPIPPPGMMDDPATFREVVGDAENPSTASFWGYLTAKNHERIVNPLLPPERSYENTYGLPVNIPSRGFSGGFQQVGYLYKKDVANPDVPVGQDPNSVIIPLYGRPLWPGANKWNYYLNSDKFQAVKMPFQVQGRSSDDDHGVNELNNGDSVDLPAYNGKFEVNIYNYDKPRYIPFVY
jgi:hypothetical protein